MSLLRTLSKGCSFAQLVPKARVQCRSFHMNAGASTEIPHVFPELLSVDPSPPPDRVNALLNMIYTHSPRTVIPFNLHCRNMKDRWIVRGLRIGAKRRVYSQERGASVVLVSGLQPHDTFSVAVSLYVAAALSRSPLACDVSVVPVAFPKEYEKRWRIDQAFSARQSETEEESSIVMKSIPSEDHEGDVEGFDSLRDVSEGPLRNYIARLGKYHVNTVLDQSPNGSLFSFKGSSLSKFKGEELVPSSDASSTSSVSSSSMFVGNDSPLLDAMMRSPTYVIQLKNSCPMDEEQLVYRADEVVKAINEVINDGNNSSGSYSINF